LEEKQKRKSKDQSKIYFHCFVFLHRELKVPFSSCNSLHNKYYIFALSIKWKRETIHAWNTIEMYKEYNNAKMKVRFNICTTCCFITKSNNYFIIAKNTSLCFFSCSCTTIFITSITCINIINKFFSILVINWFFLLLID